MRIYRIFLGAVISFAGAFPALAAADAASGWAADLDYLAAEFPNKEGGFTPDERAAFDAQLGGLRARLGSLDDEHIVVGVMQAVAFSHNGHTHANPAKADPRFGRVPIRLWSFDDGIYVVKTRPEYERLLGARLTAIGGRPIDEVMEKVSTLFYGNRSWKQHIGSIDVTVPALLYGLDLVAQRDRVEYGFVSADGKTVTETLAAEAPGALEEYPQPWWDLTPARERLDSNWKFAFVKSAEDTPLYLRDPNRNLWYEYLKNSKTFYIQYNASFFEQKDDRHALIDGLLAGIDKNHPERVVVDLRMNGGGDLTQMRGAFNRMLRDEMFQKPGHLYVITGKGTFSAGVFHSANLKQQGAIVVGELVGDDIDFWAEGGGAFELPNSKVRIFGATGFHSYSKIEHPEWKDKLYLDLSIDTLEPDIPVGMTFADYVSGRDPVMERILAEK